MHRVDVDELFQGKQSKYALVVGVSKRARQITQALEEEGVVTEDKPVLLAIEEIAGLGTRSLVAVFTEELVALPAVAAIL